MLGKQLPRRGDAGERDETLLSGSTWGSHRTGFCGNMHEEKSYTSGIYCDVSIASARSTDRVAVRCLMCLAAENG